LLLLTFDHFNVFKIPINENGSGEKLEILFTEDEREKNRQALSSFWV